MIPRGCNQGWIMCSGCGDFVKKPFTKTYKHTGISLCHECAYELLEELKNFEEGRKNNGECKTV